MIETGDDPADRYCRRYSSWPQAEQEHAETLERFRRR
ncbi:hypothetical protein GGR46_004017 [Sphingomonas kyeonggiensis]|uniref:Uncharacterized protein n=1 Tax=Sphingomonas kyeonggiensis TaxID=1268553 RepID=A0A7W6JXW5_9SPHN|nr:hypothetical protein [Sphingomonas kyeonggiensis]